MDNNNTDTEKLISYLDGELSKAESAALQTALANDAEMQQELNKLQLAKATVKNYGLTQKVATIHTTMMQEMAGQQQTKTPVRSMPRMFLRIAATILFLVGLFGFYQYITITPGSLYKEKYTAYQQGTMRGNTTAGLIEQAYNEKKYDEVIQLYKQANGTTAGEQFLTGQAYVNKADYANSIIIFNDLLQKNKTANSSLLNDDAEYYLALSYLKNNETAKALPLFKKIHDDASHLYHNKISSWYLMKLKLLNWKN